MPNREGKRKQPPTLFEVCAFVFVSDVCICVCVHVCCLASNAASSCQAPLGGGHQVKPQARMHTICEGYVKLDGRAGQLQGELENGV